MEEVQKTVLAKIYNLSASILLGKASEAEIEKITKLAKEHNLLDILREELKSLSLILTDTGKLAQIIKK